MPVSLSKDQPTKQKSGFYIGVTCPGCGGGLDLEDDLSILICDHCGTVLRVVFPDVPAAYMVAAKQAKREIRFSIDRRLKSKGMPLTSSNLEFKYLYYPYWKTDAVILKLRNRVEERVVSSETGEAPDAVYKQEKTEINLVPYHQTARAGYTLAGIPETIGVRAQYIKMVPFSDENIDELYQALPVVRSWDDVWGNVRNSVDHMNNLDIAAFGKNRTELMYPNKSLVYFPYVIVESYDKDRFLRFTVDGVTGRIVEFVDKPPPLETENIEMPVHISFGSLDVTFHRCGNCGVDFPLQKSFVSICNNCHTVDILDGPSISNDDLQVAEGDAAPSDQFYPFWSFKIPSHDASEVGRMFGGLYESDWLTIPAFKVPNFEALYRLSKRLSAAIPKLDLGAIIAFDKRYLPVTMSVKEAERLTGVIIHRQRIKCNPNASRADISFDPVQRRLLYIPFRPEHYFYVDSVLGAVTFEKALVD